MSNTSIITNLKEIHAFDFNLLVIFEAVFIYSSVSIAASKLGSSSSSVSQSLSKLRDYFSDPLFVRKGQGLVPTTVAINLHEKMSNELSELANNLINCNEAHMSNKFIIYSSSHTAQRVLPNICSTIEKTQLPYELTHINSDSSSNTGEDVLNFRKADIVFDTKPYYGNSTVTSLHMQEEIFAVCNNNHHRLKNTLNKSNMLNEKYIRTDINTPGVLKTQKTIDDYFGQRAFSFTSSSIDVNAAVTETTDFVLFVSAWFFKKFSDSYNLKKLEVDFELEPINYYMTYNKSSLANTHFSSLIGIINCNVS